MVKRFYSNLHAEISYLAPYTIYVLYKASKLQIA